MSLQFDSVGTSPKRAKTYQREPITLTQIDLTKEQALSIASFVHATDPKGFGGTDHIKLSVVDSIATVTATNRYIIAEQTFPVLSSSDGFEFLLAPEHIKAIKDTKSAVSITVIDGTMTIYKGDGSTALPTANKYVKFPEIGSIWSGVEETTKPVSALRLNFELLVKIAKLKSESDIGSKADSTFDIYLQGETETAKPKAILLKRENLRVLVQPLIVPKTNY